MNNIQTRLSTIALTTTVFIMFITIKLTEIFNTPHDFPKVITSAFIIATASAGTYILLLKILIFLLSKVRRLKKMAFGPAYLEGTWVGQLTGKTGVIYTIIEHYEQDPYELVIRGRSFITIDKPHAQWKSAATKIALSEGLLYCFYSTTIYDRSTPVEGIGHYHFSRATPSEPPTEMAGYVTDVDNGKRMAIANFRKIDDTMLEWQVAYQKYYSQQAN